MNLKKSLKTNNYKIFSYFLLLKLSHKTVLVLNLSVFVFDKQVLSNAIYKSVEHRVIVNSDIERVSLAFFYNPKSDIPIEPLKELVTLDKPALYPAMTFDEYRLFIRMRGPRGKSQVESMKSPR